MLFTETFSCVGRSTAGQLENLRRQLGVGIDPAYDYSQLAELQKKLTSKKEKKPKDDVLTGGALDLLRKAITEATAPPPEEPEEAEDADGTPGKPGVGPAQARVSQTPTWSFRARDRNSLAALDVENRFRAPPPGSYRAKYDFVDPRVKGQHDFGAKEPTKGRGTIALEKEVAKLQEENLPWEHLVSPLVSTELLDEKPERVKPRLICPNFSKDIPRPDLIKFANIQWNDNSFTAGVLDGDLVTSKMRRRPCFDFAKTSTAPEKLQETFFQPGQYNVNVGLTRPKLEVKNIPFTRQTNRKPLTLGKRLGDNLPDRSLARSCPLLSSCPRLKIPDLDHYTERPPPAVPRKADHDDSNPEIDRDVFHRQMTHDEMEAVKRTWTKAKPIGKFDQSLTREKHFKIQRSYGEDRARKMAKDNITHGPVSVEMLPMDSIGASEQFRPRVLTRDFERMAHRERQKKYAVSPSRKRDQGDAMRFGREARTGEARLEADALSPLAGDIARMRATRDFSGMVVSDP